MVFPRTFLKSRFARRVYILFILCALVPMTILAVISYVQVNRVIMGNELRGLQRNAFSQSMAVFDRLIFLDKELEIISSLLARHPNPGGAPELHRDGDLLSLHFLGLAIFDHGTGRYTMISGAAPSLPDLSGQHLQPLSSGRSMVLTDHRDEGPGSVFLIRRIPGRSLSSYAIAQIDLKYLFGLHAEYAEEESIRLTVLDEGKILFTNLPGDHGGLLVRAMSDGDSLSRGFSWSAGSGTYLSSSAHIFLKSRFVGNMWKLVLSEPREVIRAPGAMFRNIYVPVFLTALLFVLFLSMRQIRKSLIPLERLKESTRMISRGELVSHEVVRSGDEFEELSESFNAMAIKLNQQFNTLRAMAGIDRAILSLLDTDKIVETFFSRIGDVLPSDAAGVYICDSAESSAWYLYIRGVSSRGGKPPEPAIIPLAIPEKDLEPLKRYREYIVLRREDELPSYLHRLSSQDMAMFLVLPIMVKEGLFAFIVLAERHAREHSHDYIIHARQIADRMAAAFANASLIDEMNQLNWGTLTALARVVDAKSSWTAGHSERVADMAVRIGKVMGLSEKDLVTLNKAGLLHDIGKVRTPRSILNKPGKLTEEEFDIIRKHPEDSSRILEPITPYRDIIPAVIQHHERFDGKGYPYGLSGRGISLCGRILAVADSFDAMVSDRPYRKGKSMDAVLREIREEAGKQFDPKVVDALMQVVAHGGDEEERA